MKYAAVLGFILVLGACSANEIVHDNLMRGSIVRMSTSNDNLVVCLGTDAGVERNMRFTVYRNKYIGSIEEGTDAYSRTRVGEIEVDSIINEHYARAHVVSGKIERWDIVELNR